MVVVAAIDIVADAIAASVKVANRLCDLSIRIRSFSALTSADGVVKSVSSLAPVLISICSARAGTVCGYPRSLSCSSCPARSSMITLCCLVTVGVSGSCSMSMSPSAPSSPFGLGVSSVSSSGVSLGSNGFAFVPSPANVGAVIRSS